MTYPCGVPRIRVVAVDTKRYAVAPAAAAIGFPLFRDSRARASTSRTTRAVVSANAFVVTKPIITREGRLLLLLLYLHNKYRSEFSTVLRTARTRRQSPEVV